MAQIQSGVDTTLLTVDPTSKASRTSLYDAQGTMLAIKDKAVLSGSQSGLLMLGDSRGISRNVRLGPMGDIGVLGDSLLLGWDSIEGSTINTQFWTQSLTSMTVTQANGAITFNAGSSVTLGNAAIHTTAKQFIKIPRSSLLLKVRAKMTHQNNSVIEMGFGAPSGVAVVVNNGAFFRRKTDGSLVAVVAFNGTEVESSALTTPNNTSYYSYEIMFEDDRARFIVNDALGTPIVDTSLSVGLTTPSDIAASHIPGFIRIYNNTAPGVAAQVLVSEFIVLTNDTNYSKSWADALAGTTKAAYLNPTTFAQTIDYANSAAPASSTPTNTTATRTTLGGQWLVPAMAGGETDLSLFAFTVPAPYQLYITSIMISPPINQVAVSATTANVLQWGWCTNCTTNLSTGGGQRGVIPGFHTLAIAGAVGQVFAGNILQYNPKVPIVCEAGKVFHVIMKMITGAATATETFRGTVQIEGYFE